MPEGPEAKIFSEELNKFSGCTLESYELSPRATHKRVDELPIGIILSRVYSRGKRVIFEFGNCWLVFSMGMEGKFRFEKQAHLHLTLHFSSGNLYYSDHRYFGKIVYASTLEELGVALRNVGPDLLQDDISFEAYQERIIKNKRSALKNWITKQNIFSGIGNYLRSEILYRAELHPDRKLATLTVEEQLRLYEVTRKTIRESYLYGGLTLKSYQSPSGRLGRFQICVYQRQSDPLENTVLKMKVGGQNVFYVKEIQI